MLAVSCEGGQAMEMDQVDMLQSVSAACARVHMLDALAADYARFKANPLVEAWQTYQTKAHWTGAVLEQGSSANGAAHADAASFQRFVVDWLEQLRGLVVSESRRGASRLFKAGDASSGAGAGFGDSGGAAGEDGRRTDSAAATSAEAPQADMASYGETSPAKTGMNAQEALGQLVCEATDPLVDHWSLVLKRIPVDDAASIFAAANSGASLVLAAIDNSGMSFGPHACVWLLRVDGVPHLQMPVGRRHTHLRHRLFRL